MKLIIDDKRIEVRPHEEITSKIPADLSLAGGDLGMNWKINWSKRKTSLKKDGGGRYDPHVLLWYLESMIDYEVLPLEWTQN